MDWDPDFLARSPMLEPLRMVAPAFGPDWPSRADLQQILDLSPTPVCNASGVPLKLVPHARVRGAADDRYEARIGLKGELPVRERNWHDLLNVLVWRLYPRAKAALNARHHAELQQSSGPNRGPVQDALTLFDEGGVIVVSCDGRLTELLRAFRWKELFWRHRDEVRQRMRFTLFGHALYEKALSPFTGIAARGILMETEAGTLQAPLAEQLALDDARIATCLAEPGSFSTTRELAPVPVLGVPGWCEDNEREDYYDNLDYFRPGRRGSSPGFPPRADG